MAEVEAGQDNAQQEEQQTPQEGAETKQAERTYTQAELDRILGKVRKNARYLGRKEAEAELRSSPPRREAEQPAERQQPKAAPKREEYENYEDYLVAKADHAARQASREEREASEKSARERTVAEQKEQAARAFKKRAEALMQEDPDWAEKIESAQDVMVSQSMAEAIQESEVGPRILGYLVDHPDEAERIAGLSSAAAQAREIGKLEARIEAELKEKPAPKAKEGEEETEEDETQGEDTEGKDADADAKRNADGTFKSPKQARKAPAPIEPGSGRSANTNTLPSDKDDTDTWLAKRNAQLVKERQAARGR